MTAQTLTETFDYTMRDADGDTDTATLTITITGTNDTPTVTVDTGNPWQRQRPGVRGGSGDRLGCGRRTASLRSARSRCRIPTGLTTLRA